MKLRFFLLLLLFLALLFEVTYISFPLVLIVATILFLLYKDVVTLFIILFAGIIIDAFRVTGFGLTPFVLFTLFLFLSSDLWFFSNKNIVTVIVLLFCISLLYAFILSYPINIFLYLVVFGILMGSFFIRDLRKTNTVSETLTN